MSDAIIAVSLIVIPLVIGGIFSSIAWVIQRYYSIRHEKVLKRLDILDDRLRILWKCYILLQHHRVLFKKYLGIRAGKTSVDTTPEDLVKNTEPKAKNVNSKFGSIRFRNKFKSDFYIDSESDTESSDSRQTFKDVITNATHPNLHSSSLPEIKVQIQPAEIKISASESPPMPVNEMVQYENYQNVANKYDEIILSNLNNIKQLFTENMAILEPDTTLASQIIKLARFTFMYQCFRNASLDIIPNAQHGGEFPEDIYLSVKDHLSMYQAEYNSIQQQNQI